jgi:hypothetical protein
MMTSTLLIQALSIFQQFQFGTLAIWLIGDRSEMPLIVLTKALIYLMLPHQEVFKQQQFDITTVFSI